MEEPETREEVTVEAVESIAWDLGGFLRNSPDNVTVMLAEINRVTTTTTTKIIDVATDEVIRSSEGVVVVDTPSSRTWSKPFSGEDADLPGLKQRFQAAIVASNQLATQDDALETKIRNYLASL